MKRQKKNVTDTRIIAPTTVPPWVKYGSPELLHKAMRWERPAKKNKQ